MTSKKKLKRNLRYWKGAALSSRELERTWYDTAIGYLKQLMAIRSGRMAMPEDDQRLEEQSDETEEYQVGPL